MASFTHFQNGRHALCGFNEARNVRLTPEIAAVTCPDCWNDLAPNPSVRKYQAELDIDTKRGVIYVHGLNTGVTLLRIQGIPIPALEPIARSPSGSRPYVEMNLAGNACACSAFPSDNGEADGGKDKEPA